MDGLSSFEQAAVRVATQTGIAAASGADIERALVSSIISAALPAVINQALPQDVLDTLNSMPESAKKVLMSTLSSTVMAGVQGQDISDAAIKGVTKGLTSVAKGFASGAFKDLSESELVTTVNNYLSPSYEEFQALPVDSNTTVDDVIRELPKADTTTQTNITTPTDTTTTTTSLFLHRFFSI